MRLRVGEILRERGTTAYALAKASNGVISLNTAYRLSTGEFKTISARVLETLCNILEVEPAELFRREGKKARKPSKSYRVGPPVGRVIGDREYTGVWWEPENPGEPLTGTLSVDREHRAELSLVGSFRDVKQLRNFPGHPVIHGVAGNQRITLLDSTALRYSIGSPGTVTTRYMSDLVLIGAHVPQHARLTFESVSASYEHLTPWSSQSGFTQTLDHDEDQQLAGFTLTYNRPPVYATRVEGAEIRLVAGFEISGSKWEEYTARQAVRFNVVPEEPATLEQLRTHFFHRLQNLVAFGVGKPVALLEMHGTLSEVHDADGDNSRVEILFHRGRRGGSGEIKEVMPWDMFFTFNDLHEDFQLYLQNWLGRSAKLEPVFNLYFGTMFNDNMYEEHRFLSLIQAAESYHRLADFRNSVVTKEDFRPLRKKLRVVIDQAGLPEEEAGILKSKMTFWNEIVLKDRLQDLLNAEAFLISHLIPNTETFVQKVVSTRNYLTHFTSKSKARAASGRELTDLSEQLRFLLELRLLSELGFSDDKKSKIIERNRHYGWQRKQILGRLAKSADRETE
jgi:DNA-binding Xre family transcriptional regulator